MEAKLEVHYLMAETSTLEEDLEKYGSEEVEPETKWTVFLRFPILYENAVSDSDTNGIGALSDTLSCTVTRTSNQFATMQLVYKRDGIHAQELREGRVIMTDKGPDLVHQKFRINQVTKTQENITVNATEIAGDLSYNTITKDIQVPSASADDTFNSIVNNLADPMSDIRFDTNISAMSNVNMQMSDGNASNYLISADQMGDEPVQSMVALYHGEWVFDDYHFYFWDKAGKDTGIVIKYGRNLKTINQDTNIANTYTAGYFYAKYTPAPPKATVSNEDWNAVGEEVTTAGTGSGYATVTYAAGGIVDVYDAPVTGHHIIRQVHNGDRIKLGRKITDGYTLKDKKVVNTVNGDEWYYVYGGGWINARWITFDKRGDYLVTNSVGHSTVVIDSGNEKQTKYPFSGVGIISNPQAKKVRVFYSPFFGTGHVPTGETVANGTSVHFDYYARNQKGNEWYRMSGKRHHWIYAPHISFKKDGSYISAPTKGKGYVKPGQQKYIMKKGKMVKAPKQTKLVSARTKKTKKWINKTYTGWVTGKNGKKFKQKITTPVLNPVYKKSKKKKVKATVPKGYANIRRQVQINGTTYYQTGNNVYVKSSSIDFKKRMSQKPQTLSKYEKSKYTSGKVEMYFEPKLGSIALNWAIPAGESLDTGVTAQGPDGQWTYVTYHGQSGWVQSKFLKNVHDDDFDPYNPDDAESSDDTQDSGNDDNTNVDQQDIMVTLPEGVLYSNNAYNEEVARVQNVDLSSDFVHDYQDVSGLDESTGQYHMTDADVQQLRNLAEGYMKEYRFGYPNVSLTLTAEQISDFGLDSIGLYDRVTVQFDQLGVYETAEVNSTTWDAMAHRYTEVTIGDIPPTYEHLLLNQAKKQTDLAHASSVNRLNGITQLTSQIHDALNQEGSDRAAAEQKIAKEIGLYKTSTNGKLTEMSTSMKSFESAMQSYDSQMQQANSWIRSGGSDVLQFVDASGNQTYQNPVEIRAKTGNNGWMIFNSNGLLFTDPNNISQTAASIDSEGWINAEHINAGTIQTLNANDLNVQGAFTAKVNSFEVTMGAYNSNLDSMGLLDVYGRSIDSRKGLGVASYNYGTFLSSGALYINDRSFHRASLGPSYLSMNGTASSLDIQLNDLNKAPFRIMAGANQYIMKRGAMSIKAASGQWHRVITSGNIQNACYVTINGSRHYINVDGSKFGSISEDQG